MRHGERQYERVCAQAEPNKMVSTSKRPAAAVMRACREQKNRQHRTGDGCTPFNYLSRLLMPPHSQQKHIHIQATHTYK